MDARPNSLITSIRDSEVWMHVFSYFWLSYCGEMVRGISSWLADNLFIGREEWALSFWKWSWPVNFKSTSRSWIWDVSAVHSLCFLLFRGKMLSCDWGKRRIEVTRVRKSLVLVVVIKASNNWDCLDVEVRSERITFSAQNRAWYKYWDRQLQSRYFERSFC